MSILNFMYAKMKLKISVSQEISGNTPIDHTMVLSYYCWGRVNDNNIFRHWYWYIIYLY